MASYGIPTKAIHEQWLGLVQPVGLVVAPAVLSKLELVPNQSTKRLSQQLLAQTSAKREAWLDEQAGVKLKLPAKVKQELKATCDLNETGRTFN